MRKLAPDEAELWAKVTATIRPLSRKGRSADVVETPIGKAPSPPPAKPSRVKGRVPPLRSPAAPVVPRRVLETGGLDGSWNRRLKSGSVVPDRVLDLHGHSLDRAWSAIDRGIEAAIEAEDRVVLLITGHARPGAPPIERGKIRAAVNDWLAHSRHADRIASVRGAHRRHGGGGSLYLILRR